MKKILLFSVSTLIILILGIIFVSNTNTTAPSTNGQNNPASNMDDHHQAQSGDQGVFSALLNKEAPDFTLQSFDGKTFHLKDLKGKKVVLFFSEGIMCYPACWNQIAAIGKDQRLNGTNIVTLNIVDDKSVDWQPAVKQMPDLTSGIILLDTNKVVSSAYGVLSLPSSMHKGNFPGHTYLVVDTQGIVRYEFDDTQMGVRNDQLIQEVSKIN